MNLVKILLAATLALATTLGFAAAVEVNKASQAELETIKGVGPAMSGKILEARKTGNFKDWNDMVDRVSGIGNGNAAKFSAAGLTVNGAAYAGAPAATATPAKGARHAPAKAATTEAAPAATITTAKK